MTPPNAPSPADHEAIAANPLYGFLRLGIFIGGCGLVMIFVQPPNSAQFVLSVCSALLGLLLVVGVVIVSRLGRSWHG